MYSLFPSHDRAWQFLQYSGMVTSLDLSKSPIPFVECLRRAYVKCLVGHEVAGYVMSNFGFNREYISDQTLSLSLNYQRLSRALTSLAISDPRIGTYFQEAAPVHPPISSLGYTLNICEKPRACWYYEWDGNSFAPGFALEPFDNRVGTWDGAVRRWYTNGTDWKMDFHTLQDALSYTRQAMFTDTNRTAYFQATIATNISNQSQRIRMWSDDMWLFSARRRAGTYNVKVFAT